MVQTFLKYDSNPWREEQETIIRQEIQIGLNDE